MTKIICSYCNKSFDVKPSRSKKAKYCSLECFAAGKSKIASHTRKKLSKIDKAYIAGFLDGEGTITLTKAKKKNGFYIRPFIIVGNTDHNIIQWLLEITGLGTVYGGNKPFKQNWRKVWRWQVSSNQARLLLQDIYPYLKIKKAEAKIVMSFPRMKSGKDLATYNKQLDLLQQIRDMNQRSKPPQE